MDVALVASELIDTKIRNDVLSVICKLYIEKVYGHLNWNYLGNTCRQMGFGAKWIEFCIKTTMFSIMINGEHAGFFPAEGGLKQGDPLSPFAFIIVMEGLKSSMRKASINNWIRGLVIKK